MNNICHLSFVFMFKKFRMFALLILIELVNINLSMNRHSQKSLCPKFYKQHLHQYKNNWKVYEKRFEVG